MSSLQPRDTLNGTNKDSDKEEETQGRYNSVTFCKVTGTYVFTVQCNHSCGCRWLPKGPVIVKLKCGLAPKWVSLHENH